MYTILRGGYNSKHAESFIMSRPKGLTNYLLLIVKSRADFQIENIHFITEPDSAILIPPDTPYRYAGLEKEYKNDWIHFQCSDADFDEKYRYLMNKPIRLSNGLQFTQYFQHLIWEQNYASDRYHADNVTFLFQVLINKLCQEYETGHHQAAYNPFASRLQDLRLNIQSQPNHSYSPEEFASALNVSVSYFQFLYKEFFGIPFKKDVINMRLEYTRDLILNSTLSFQQIALMSGYSNEIHFYRQFKAKTGMTPKEYRTLMHPDFYDPGRAE